MNDSTLKVLLKEYEQKRLSESISLEGKIRQLYSSNKRLEQIDFELNSFAISTAKLIIASPSDYTSLDKLKNKIEVLKSEKSVILKSLNLDDTFFAPNYECTQCNDTGYVRDGYNYNLCNCIKQKLFNIEYNKSNISNINKENFDNFDLNLYSDKINESLYNSNMSPRQNISNIKEFALSFVSNFDNFNEKNLLFTGNTGLRKNFYI